MIRAKRSNWSNEIDIAIFDRERRVIAMPLVLHQLTEDEWNSKTIEAAAHLETNDAQVLMDDLWNCGIRPTDGAGTAGSMRATEKHLDDMRAIVEKQLQVKLL